MTSFIILSVAIAAYLFATGAISVTLTRYNEDGSVKSERTWPKP